MFLKLLDDRPDDRHAEMTVATQVDAIGYADAVVGDADLNMLSIGLDDDGDGSLRPAGKGILAGVGEQLVDHKADPEHIVGRQDRIVPGFAAGDPAVRRKEMGGEFGQEIAQVVAGSNARDLGRLIQVTVDLRHRLNAPMCFLKLAAHCRIADEPRLQLEQGHGGLQRVPDAVAHLTDQHILLPQCRHPWRDVADNPDQPDRHGPAGVSANTP